MASLRMKPYQVLVRWPGSSLGFGPDISREVTALTEITAIQSVMRGAMVAEARAVYVQCEGQGHWFCGVALVNGQVLYEYAV